MSVGGWNRSAEKVPHAAGWSRHPCHWHRAVRPSSCRRSRRDADPGPVPFASPAGLAPRDPSARRAVTAGRHLQPSARPGPAPVRRWSVAGPGARARGRAGRARHRREVSQRIAYRRRVWASAPPRRVARDRPLPAAPVGGEALPREAEPDQRGDAGPGLAGRRLQRAGVSEGRDGPGDRRDRRDRPGRGVLRQPATLDDVVEMVFALPAETPARRTGGRPDPCPAAPPHPETSPESGPPAARPWP